MIKEATIIQFTKAPTVLTGSLQFGNDWPGTFITLAYLKHIFSRNEPDTFIESSNPLSNLSQRYINSTISDLYQFTLQFPKSDDNTGLSLNLQMLEEYLPRVETGPVCINGQYGYFMRGDHASYIHQLLHIKKEISPLEQTIKDIFSLCIVK